MNFQTHSLVTVVFVLLAFAVLNADAQSESEETRLRKAINGLGVAFIKADADKLDSLLSIRHVHTNSGNKAI